MLVLQLLNCFPLLLIQFPFLLAEFGIHYPLRCHQEGSFKRRKPSLDPEAEIAGVAMKDEPPEENDPEGDHCMQHGIHQTVPDDEGQTVLLEC